MNRSYPTLPWWQAGVVYQVYPRSFQDSNGDGVGDLAGVRARLDYLQWLGVDAIWLSPIFRSPMADFGYDVADYLDVDSIFGTLEDLDALIAAAHERRIKVLLDFVPNHTSDRHRWFLESRSSRANSKRSWYIWRDPGPGGRPPNGWQSVFGGSAWELDDATGQSYFHSFLKEQPDLDWTNPDVRAEMHDVLRFWFRRGIDGFRIDVINLIAKKHELKPQRGATRRQVWGDESRIHDLVRDMRAVADEFEDRVLIGETWLPLKKLIGYYGRDSDELHLPFNFQLLNLEWKAATIGGAIARYEQLLPPGAWPNWVLGNHDRPRIATRIGAEQARVAAMLLLTLRGTPTLYYGDELGMANVEIGPDQQRDPARFGPEGSRDPERTPMRWDGSPNAAFTTGTPWLPIGPEVSTANVAAEREDPHSMLSLYRALLELRKREPALAVGSLRNLRVDGDVLAYERSHEGRTIAVALNLGAGEVVANIGVRGARLLLSTHDRTNEDLAYPTIALRPNEGIVLDRAPSERARNARG